ncbi:hypothetical protein [Streptomyces sp. NPDC008150]|uniref:hypothetical protein n=1 Tax=Streptomyces sp. NPDC008150 TaxID=3364816 RepID=UPI0036E7B5BC
MDIPDELIDLEYTAETERAKLAGLDGEAYQAQWVAWRDAATAALGTISKHAASAGEDRYKLEMAVKRAVRHQEQDPAE